MRAALTTSAGRVHRRLSAAPQCRSRTVQVGNERRCHPWQGTTRPRQTRRDQSQEPSLRVRTLGEWAAEALPGQLGNAALGEACWTSCRRSSGRHWFSRRAVSVTARPQHRRSYRATPQNSTGASLRRGSVLSLADRIARSGVTGQAMPRSGSFHRMPASFWGE